MKKYKYSRKEALIIARDSGYGYKTFEKYLLAKESNEEYSQRIMMEQVPKQEDNKECTCVNCLSEKVCKSIICDSKKLYKDLTTPSPLDDIEEIEAPKVFSETRTTNGLITEFGFTDEFINWVEEISKTFNLIIKQLKQK